MADLEHPEITRVNRTGITSWQQEKHYGNDALDQEVLAGDEIYVVNDEFYLKEYLNPQAEELLKSLGAELKIARLLRR